MKLLPITGYVARYQMDDGSVEEVSLSRLAALGLSPEDIPRMEEPLPAEDTAKVMAWLDGTGPYPFEAA